MSEPRFLARFVVTSRLVGVYAGAEDREWFAVDTATTPRRAEWDATEADARARVADLNRRAAAGEQIAWDESVKAFVV